MRIPLPPSTVVFTSSDEAHAWAMFFAAQCKVIAFASDSANALDVAAASADEMLEAWRARVQK